MAKWADYCVSKLSLNEYGYIDNVVLYDDHGEYLSSDAVQRSRPWMVQQVAQGKTFSSVKRNEHGTWNRIGDFEYDGSIFKWYTIPTNSVCRKTFLSFYHRDNEKDRIAFENLFGDLIVNKSVNDGDIDSENSDEYVKQLIQNGYLDDTTVLIALIGPKTKCRKHIDWEISGALNYKVGGTYAGLLGILLKDHPDFGSGKATYDLMPARLADNFKSKYAIIRDWTDDRSLMQSYIELAFENRIAKDKQRDNSRTQMTKNNCE